MSLAKQKLSGREIEQFENRIRGTAKDWDTGLTSPHGFIRHYVLREIINTGRLTKMAHKVKTAVYRFQKEKPRVVLVDGVKNYPHRTFLDLARHHDCKTFYIWHAPLASEEFGYDALGSEPRQTKLVDHLLAWGELEKPWLQLLGVNIPTTRTGTPHLVAAPSANDCQAAGTQKIKRVLVLDYSVIASDLLATNATKYEFLIDVVQKLRKIGVEEIRFKLHPGRPQKSYYHAIVDSFGLDCDIYKSEPIEELTDWADAVIGPVHSSSMFKVISRGKDYYAFLLQPTWQNEQCYKHINILNSVDELEAAIAEKRHAGGPEKLDHIASWLSINDPAREIWDTLDQYA